MPLGLLLQRNKSPPTWGLDFQISVDTCRYINGAMFLYILISQIERLAFPNGGRAVASHTTPLGAFLSFLGNY